MDKTQQVELALQDAIAHITKTIEVQKASQNSDEVLLQATKQLSNLIDIISAKLLQEIKDRASTDELQTLLKALTVLRDQALSALDKWNANGMPFLEHNFKGLAELTLYEVQQIRIKTEQKKIDLNLNGHELFEMIVKNEEQKENPLGKKKAELSRLAAVRMEKKKEAELQMIKMKIQKEKHVMMVTMEREKMRLISQSKELHERVRYSQMKMMELMSNLEKQECMIQQKMDMMEQLKCQIEEMHYQLAEK